MTETQEIRRRMDNLSGPLGIRLVMAMTSAIEDRTLSPGVPLPPEREFAAGLGISRSTLRQSLEQLAKDGYVATRPGAGTFIAHRILKPVTRLTGFTDDMLSRGLKPSSRILECRKMPVPPDVSFRTGLPLGTEVMLLARLRQIGDDVMGMIAPSSRSMRSAAITTAEVRFMRAWMRKADARAASCRASRRSRCRKRSPPCSVSGRARRCSPSIASAMARKATRSRTH